MDTNRRENSEMKEDLAAIELMQYTKERLPRYGWLFTRSAIKSDPGSTHREG